MGLYTHSTALSFIVVGLSIIAYGSLFGFIKRDPTALRVGLEACFHRGVDFKVCIRTLEKSEKDALLVVIALISFAALFVIMEIFAAISAAYCCRNFRSIKRLQKALMGLVFIVVFDLITYTVSSIIYYKYDESNSSGLNVSSVAGVNAYIIARYTGIAVACIALAWIVTIIVGSPMTASNSFLMKAIVLISNSCIVFFVLAVLVGTDAARLLRHLSDYQFKAKQMGCALSVVAVLVYIFTFLNAALCNTSQEAKE